MKYIDLHCDTAYRMLNEDLNLKDSICKVTLDKLKKGDALSQIFAFFIDLGEIKKSPFEEFNKMYNNFIEEVNTNKDEIEVIKDIKRLSYIEKDKKIGAILSIEEGEVLEGKVNNVSKVSELGIKIITLTWNYENTIGYPNYNFIFKDKGLKEKGIEIVSEMEKFNMIPDASHLSDGGFYDLLRICKKPFIATHSNAREVKNHPRNLTDDMIKKLSEKGGVMGLNFCSDFVGKSEITKVKDIVRHAKHIKNVGGIDVLSLGSDFDGIENEVEIKDTSEMNKLYYALKKEKFTDDDIEKVFYKNIIRVLE
ncbi:membrane dipeptidase [Clostridium sp. Ade.TY]|uniref:dipeptidase n=1 Tax=Clostridium sp. Ade.TY TaxID=1391647 RepID=UPI0003FBE90C|nr:membrane dipeptidase [Clostridium sp. Ade.TY]